jgi:hypothetical protein
MSKINPTEAAARARRKSRLFSEEAIEALRQVYLDPKAQASARATAAATVVRVAGLFDKDEDVEGKQHHEMNGEELQAAIDRLKRKASGHVDDPAADEDEEED